MLNNTNNNTKAQPIEFLSEVGRPPAFRWPGLERLKERVENSGPIFFPRTRQEELALAVEEAAAREEKYSSAPDTTNIEVDFDALRFDPGPEGPQGAHTTIDLDKITDTSALAYVTTSDFVVFNKIKRIMFGPDGAAAINRGWSIIDLKFNQTNTALFFVTVAVPVGELKKILNKFKT